MCYIWYGGFAMTPALSSATTMLLLYDNALNDDQKLLRLIQSLTVNNSSAPLPPPLPLPQPQPQPAPPEDEHPSQKIYTMHSPTHSSLSNQW